MKHLALAIILALFSLHAFSQDQSSKFDLRFGIGTSFLGTGDMITLMFENEVNYKLDRFLTLGGSIAYAKSDAGVHERSSFVQLNSNLYFSPFKNTGKNDFRIGTGLSWYSVFNFRPSRIFGQEIDYTFDRRKSIGLNIILENTYKFTERLLLGAKLFTQPYQNGDINSGFLIKLGIKI